MSLGIRGAALSWISSFVRQMTQTVADNGKMPETSLVTCYVPQGSVVGSILFLLYTADVALIVEMPGINFHSYANDSELFLHAKVHEIDFSHPRVVSCIDAIDRWMSSNRLNLNFDKTQVIVLGSSKQLSTV